MGKKSIAALAAIAGLGVAGCGGSSSPSKSFSVASQVYTVHADDSITSNGAAAFFQHIFEQKGFIADKAFAECAVQQLQASGYNTLNDLTKGTTSSRVALGQTAGRTCIKKLGRSSVKAG